MQSATAQAKPGPSPPANGGGGGGGGGGGASGGGGGGGGGASKGNGEGKPTKKKGKGSATADATRCANCGGEGPLQRCGGCGVVHYCRKNITTKNGKQVNACQQVVIAIGRALTGRVPGGGRGPGPPPYD